MKRYQKIILIGILAFVIATMVLPNVVSSENGYTERTTQLIITDGAPYTFTADSNISFDHSRELNIHLNVAPVDNADEANGRIYYTNPLNLTDNPNFLITSQDMQIAFMNDTIDVYTPAYVLKDGVKTDFMLHFAHGANTNVVI